MSNIHLTFDFDGTIVDSEDNFLELLQVLLPRHINREFSAQNIRDIYVPDWHQLLVNAGAEKVDEDFINKVIDDASTFNRDFMPEVFPGVLEMIHELKKLGCVTHLWTGRDQRSGREVLRHHNIEHLFEGMHFRDTCRAKPHPEGLEKLVGEIQKEKVIHIGDSLVDLEGAKRFGVDCLIVDWREKEDRLSFIKSGASEFVTNPREVLDWLKNKYL